MTVELCETCGLPTLVEGWDNPAEFRDFVAFCRGKRDRSALKEAGLPEGTDIDWAVQQSGHALFFEQKAVSRGASQVWLNVGQHLMLPILSQVGLAFVLLVEAPAGDIMRLDTRMWIAEWDDLPAAENFQRLRVSLDAFVPTSGAGLVRGVREWQDAAVSCGCGQDRLESEPTCFRPMTFGYVSGDGETGWSPFDWRWAFYDPEPHQSEQTA